MNDNSAFYSIKDIEAHTGLSPAYIEKCINRLSPFLAPHCRGGDKDSRLFDSNALVIFNQIKRMKEEGLSLKDIYKHLEETMGTGTTDPSALAEATVKTGQAHIRDMVQLMERHHEEMRQEVEKRLRLQSDKDQVIRKLETELEKQERRLIRIKEKYREIQSITEIKSIDITQWWRRRNLMKELGELLEHF
jgi:DNA-binding transcriptional MerR regulator